LIVDVDQPLTDLSQKAEGDYPAVYAADVAPLAIEFPAEDEISFSLYPIFF